MSKQVKVSDVVSALSIGNEEVADIMEQETSMMEELTNIIIDAMRYEAETAKIIKQWRAAYGEVADKVLRVAAKRFSVLRPYVPSADKPKGKPAKKATKDVMVERKVKSLVSWCAKEKISIDDLMKALADNA